MRWQGARSSGSSGPPWARRPPNRAKCTPSRSCSRPNAPVRSAGAWPVTNRTGRSSAALIDCLPEPRSVRAVAGASATGWAPARQLGANGLQRDHQGKTVGGGGFEAIAAIEAAGVLVDGVDEDGADADLLGCPRTRRRASRKRALPSPWPCQELVTASLASTQTGIG